MDKINFISKIEEVFGAQKEGRIYKCAIEEAERKVIEKALNCTKGNQLLASRILGVNRNTLRTKIRKFNINTDYFKI